MSIQRIPNTPELLSYQFEVELDDDLFSLSFSFNVRDRHWYLDVYDRDKKPIRNSIKIVDSWDIFRIWKQPDRPRGTVYSLIQGMPDNPEDRNKLGKYLILDYLDNKEIRSVR